MKITKFDKINLRELRTSINKALEEVIKSHEINLSLGNIRFSENNFSVKLNGLIVSKTITTPITKVNPQFKTDMCFKRKNSYYKIIGFRTGVSYNITVVNHRGKTYFVKPGFLEINTSSVTLNEFERHARKLAPHLITQPDQSVFLKEIYKDLNL